MPEINDNEEFKVLEYRSGDDTVQVFLLNVRDTFAGFGGSRHGLTVNKTASLIVRYTGPGGCRDHEHNINDKAAWNHIRDGIIADL